jgi:hypothetical protein
MFSFGSEVLVPMMIFAIPIVAVAGGITAGIIKTMSRHRVIEMAQRERIAAIERGIDPAKLPPLPAVFSDDDGVQVGMSPRQASLRRSRELLVGGIITLAVGVGLGIMLYYITDEEGGRLWAIGAIPALVGLALLLSSFLYSRFALSDGDGTPKA